MKTVLIRIYYSLGFKSPKKRDWTTLSCIMMFLVLFVGQTMFPNSAISQYVFRPKTEKENAYIAKRNIETLKHIENAQNKIPNASVGHIGQILGEVDFAYSIYNAYLGGGIGLDVEILQISDPAILKAKYEEDVNNKSIETLHALIRFLDVQKKYNIRPGSNNNQFVKKIDSVIQRAEKMEQQAIESGDLHQMLLVYYWLRFIEPYQDAKVRMEAMVPKIKERQAALILEREIASIKAELRDSINKGETRIELEQRISKLPENERISIEELRKKLLEEKSLQVAKTQEKKEKIEKVARRQAEIDQAIKWRKEELETGKINPKAQEQRQKDQEIKRAVELWEMEYKKQLAEKKADEAKRILAEKERAKQEEQRSKQVEAAERKKGEEAEKRKTTLAKYNVKAKISAADLHKNPFQFEGKAILLTGVTYDRMLEKGLAVFTYSTGSMEWVGDLQYGRPVISTSTQELLVSNVPVDFSKGYVNLIVKCKGTTKATNQLGATITLPFVEYIAVFQE